MRVTRWTQHAILKRSLCIWYLVPPHPPPHFCTPVPLPSVSLCPHPAASRNCFHLAASDLHLSTSIWEEINMGVLFFIMHLVSLAHTAIVIEWYVLSIYIYMCFQSPSYGQLSWYTGKYGQCLKRHCIHHKQTECEQYQPLCVTLVWSSFAQHKPNGWQCNRYSQHTSRQFTDRVFDGQVGKKESLANSYPIF